MDNLKIEEIWAEAKNLLKAETTEITFQTWIERIVVETINDNNIILSVETPFAAACANWLFVPTTNVSNV